jgi:predicted DNA-binding transcriptional regulator AlpA
MEIPVNKRNQAIKYGGQYIPESGRKLVGPLIPEIGYLRLRYIIGDSKADPPVPAIIPVCASTWWGGVKKGIYPTPVRLSRNCTAWRVEDIRDLIDRINSEGVDV